MRDSDDWWVFIDWQAELNKQASAQGVLIYCLQRASGWRSVLNRSGYPTTLPRSGSRKEAALHHLWDNDRQVFISGAVRQVSWASQIWLVLAKLAPPGSVRRADAPPAAAAARHCHEHPVPASSSHCCPATVRPARGGGGDQSLLGAMVAYGADTFWEIFDPNILTFSRMA